MSVLRIIKHGEKVLKTPCPTADFQELSPRLPELLRDMWATMRAARGVGLAAPQVGLSLRLAVIDTRPEGKNDPLVLINPEIISTDGQLKDEEGCLSLPGVYSKLPRFAKVRVRALGEDGKPWERTGEGLLARAFQHEIDHLDGKLYIDRLPFETKLKALDAIKEAKLTWA